MIIKERIALLSLTTMCASSAMAQITTNQSPNEPVPPPALEWRATARDGCSTTHEAREFITNSVTGEVTDRTRRYIEVASGLNYLNDIGEWCPSEDLIELTADGGAAALRGPTKVRFNANLNTTGAISITTQSNRVFKTRPLAIVFRDAKSGRVAVVATLQDCVGELLPPNQVVYRGAFGALADIRLTYTKAAVESDLILLQQPKLPEGWDAKSARLELWHEWLGAPTPRQTARPIYREADEALRQKMLDPDVEDQILDFGDLWFPTGAAFATDAASVRETNVAAQVRVPSLTLDTNLLAVAKTWLSAGNRSVLVETLRWEDVQPKLGRLPPVAAAATMTEAKDRMDCLSRLPAVAAASRAGQTMRLAQTAYAPTAVLLDYITVPGSGNYTFEGYNPSLANTYYVSSGGYFNTLTFNAHCVIKYAPGCYLLAYGAIICNGSTYDGYPSILTSRDDDVFGDPLPFSTHNPGYAANPAVWSYYIPGGGACGMRIRWANEAVRVDRGEYIPHYVGDCNFEFCYYGASGGCTLSVKVCNVQVPYTPPYELEGSVTDICAGGVNADQNEFQDLWEYRHFGNVGVSASADPDGDYASNLLEYQQSTNPRDWPSFSSFPAYQIVPVGNSASFSATPAQGGLSLQWYKNGWTLPGATTTSVTLQNLQASDNGTVVLRAENPLGWVNTTYGRLVVLDSTAWSIWTTFQATSSGKTPQMYSYSCGPWHQDSLLRGRTGFTAISHCNEIQGSSGQIPITALTRRHGVTAGHTLTPCGAYCHYTGCLDTWNGKKVTFWAENGQRVDMTIARMYMRYGNGYDYTVVFFTSDLPDAITPMKVMAWPWVPGSYGVVLKTCQHNYMSANVPPFDWADPSRPLFNDHSTYIGGDSGSPNMIPMLDGLAFIGMTSGSPPSCQMQCDMDALSQWGGLREPYPKMQWYGSDPCVSYQCPPLDQCLK